TVVVPAAVAQVGDIERAAVAQHGDARHQVARAQHIVDLEVAVALRIQGQRVVDRQHADAVARGELAAGVDADRAADRAAAGEGAAVDRYGAVGVERTIDDEGTFGDSRRAGVGVRSGEDRRARTSLIQTDGSNGPGTGEIGT